MPLRYEIPILGTHLYDEPTYITGVNHFTRGKAEIITGHSGQEIIMKNYEDQKVFDSVYMGFRMMKLTENGLQTV